MPDQINSRLNLAHLPTPLLEVKFKKHRFIIKRDDLTGLELSGNKARKLDYLMFEASKQKADVVFTSGGLQSNHARATAFAASMCGIKSKLFLWGRKPALPEANLFMNSFIGADITFINKEQFLNNYELMLTEAGKYQKRTGKKVYVIPEGGSSATGVPGYINFIEEVSEQINLNNLSGVLTAAGSGGTAAGMLIGAALMDIDIKIYAVNVLYSKEVLEAKVRAIVDSAVKKFKYIIDDPLKRLVILGGYSAEGYKKIKSDKIKLIKDFAVETGIILDPVYTGKAFNAYYKELKCDPEVLFLHTGGLFGVFDKRAEYLGLRK